VVHHISKYQNQLILVKIEIEVQFGGDETSITMELQSSQAGFQY